MINYVLQYIEDKQEALRVCPSKLTTAVNTNEIMYFTS